jgi:tyrosine-specific transport protein
MMMNTQTGSILLIAGTCIGSGMIALPLVLAKVGLLPSMIIMMIIWALSYYTSLINLELNLQAGKGYPLGILGRLYSGRGAEFTGTLSLKILSYSLVAVYLYGGTSILRQLLENSGIHSSFTWIMTGYSLIAMLTLLLPIRLIDYVNRLLFMGLMGIFLLLIMGLVSMIEWKNLPLLGPHVMSWTSWQTLIPVVFTSFGFQVIFHTLTEYCNRNASYLKKAFLWGSFIPALVYIVWTLGVLSVIHTKSPGMYQEMVEGSVDVGKLIQELSRVAEGPWVQLLVWWLSFFAISTSLIGVVVGLTDSLKESLSSLIPGKHNRTAVPSFLAICPAYLVALWVPNAFISILGFAGMILVVIAIILPLYLLKSLFRKNNTIILNYSELTYASLLILSGCIGVVIMLCEIRNMLN